MKIVICECVSNGVFLLEDCRRLGLEPVVVFPPVAEGDSLVTDARESAVEFIGDSVEVLYPESLDELVERLSGEDIACIIPGSEYGIVYADLLTTALGFPGNDPESTYRRTTKFGMHESLREAGLRYIPSRMVRCKEDIESFWEEFSPDKVVVKPDASVGTLGLSVCEDVDSAVKAVEGILGTTSWTGDVIDHVLVQEMIGGDEYIVNTVSRNGVHKITDVWLYTKVEMGGGVVPIGVRTVTDPDDRERGLAEYALRVLDAVGLREGPSHLEIKMDAKGPVLIEVNARPMGGHFSVPALDAALGHHITDLVLRSMLDERAHLDLPEGIPAIGGMHMVVLVVYKSRYIDLAPLSELVRNLHSFFHLFCPLNGCGRTYVETSADYISSIGSVELVHDDTRIMEEDFSLLWDAEETVPDLLYGPDAPLPPVERGDVTYPDGTVLVLDPAGIRVHGIDGFRECDGDEMFDECIVDLYGTVPLEEIYRNLFGALARLVPGGRVIVPPHSFDVVPYGRKGMFRILMMANLDFDIPGPSEPIVATKGL